jgi:hypothetical protein
MLAADKLQLQSALKQQAVSLKEKEFNLHHSNLMTVGTQAAVLAGLDITMFIEFTPAPEHEWGPSGHAQNLARALKVIYYGVIVAAFCCNMVVVSQTTALSVLGAGLALRGPDGSMMVATDCLYEERSSVFKVFGWGLACTVGSVLVSVWLLLRWEAAVVCWLVAAKTCHLIWSNYVRVHTKLDFDESQTVDFRDILQGPAAIRIKSGYYNKKKTGSSSSNNPRGGNNDRSRGGGGGGWSRSTSRASSSGGRMNRGSFDIEEGGQDHNHNTEEDSDEYSYYSFHGDDTTDTEMQQKKSLLNHHGSRKVKQRRRPDDSRRQVEPIQTI